MEEKESQEKCRMQNEECRMGLADKVELTERKGISPPLSAVFHSSF